MTISDGRTQEFLPTDPFSSAHATVQVTSDGALGFPVLPFTGERIVPGQVSEPLFLEHEARYVFAGRFVKEKDVLDVACGTGIGTHYLLMAGARSCLGLDIDGPAIDYAKLAYKGCQFAQCDAGKLSVPDRSIDVVVSFETIEHLNDHVKFLSECNRVLRPGGVLICSTPNRTMSRWAPENTFHVHEFTLREFKQAIESVFVDVRLFGQRNMNQLLYAGRCLLSRSLHAMRLMRTAKRFLGWRTAPVLAVQTEFGAVPIDSDNEIRPYHPAALIQPKYAIAVAQRPEPRDARV